ncbi:hypothetical protein [Micromonospora endolithica]|nr:hypothetical protein [Micromonospora endolithica]TWJ20959.1 hypothetical protein JD76_01059 [Micromonospora endolithica]
MRRYLTPARLVGHLVVLVVAGVFVRLGWWQFEHALAGNTLSYGYALQWPVFAAFGVFFWIRLLTGSPPDRTPKGGGPSRGPAAAPVAVPLAWTFQRSAETIVPEPTPQARRRESEDPDVLAYNEMLAWLHADPARRVEGYPGYSPARRWPR